jgi:ABC-2 type transport system ATP-binding protein
MYSIQIDRIQKNYQDFSALKGVSFNVEEGEFFGLLGPNGAGKTTLISILAGLASASSGTARIHGFDVVKDYREARRRVGIVPQELVFDPFLTVRESLCLQSGYYGLRRKNAWIDELMHHLDLTDKADSNMRALSGGMKRRVLVAQALVHRPPVIVLDEPTAGVDVELRQTLWKFIAQLNKDGHTIVLTTHYLEEAEELCNRIAMLRQGKVVALDHTAALLKGFASNQLVLTLSAGQLPDNLKSLEINHKARGTVSVPGKGKAHVLQLNAFDEIEAILGQCRQAGCVLEEVEIRRADLERVFLQVMKNAGQSGNTRLSSHAEEHASTSTEETAKPTKVKANTASSTKDQTITDSAPLSKTKVKSTTKSTASTSSKETSSPVRKATATSSKESAPKKRVSAKEKTVDATKETK